MKVRPPIGRLAARTVSIAMVAAVACSGVVLTAASVNTILQTCFFALSGVMPLNSAFPKPPIQAWAGPPSPKARL